MSDFVSPDASATGSEGAASGGKPSFMEKVKIKAKDKTQKLKSKLAKNPQSGSTEGGAGENDTSSSSSSDEEEKEAPVNNAMTGMTQPQFEKKLKDGDPAALAGAPSATTQGDKDVGSELSRDFEGLSTGEKDKPVTEKASESLYGAKDAAEEKLGTGDYSEGKPVTEKASESLYGAKGAAEEKLGTGDYSGDKPVTEKATEGFYGAKDSAAEKLGGDSTTGGDKPVTEKATDSLYAAKDQAAEKLGTGAGGASVVDSLPETVKPTDETRQAATDYYNTAAAKVSEYTTKTTDKAYDIKDSGSTEEAANKATDTGKSWAQWAAEKVGYGKDVAGEKLPKTEDGTSAPDAAIGKATEAKDTISQKAGEAADTASAKAEETSASQ